MPQPYALEYHSFISAGITLDFIPHVLNDASQRGFILKP